MAIEFHPEAVAEAAEARAWYESEDWQVAVDFQDELDRAFDQIEDAPHRWSPHKYGTRRFLLRRFPFSVIYLPDPGIPFVVAVMHHRRRPGYWRDRLS